MAIKAYTGMRTLIADKRTRACVLSSQINAADARRKEVEQKAAATRSAAIERKPLKKPERGAPPLVISNRSLRRAIRWIQSLLT
jgi:hypothetical protein